MPRPFRRTVTIPAAGTWPEQENTVEIPAFSWYGIENRGVLASGNDVQVSILGPIRPGDKPDAIVAAGTSIICNIGGQHDPPAESLHLVNVGGAAVDVFIETATWDSPIVRTIQRNA
jgi:hypothetical protein